MWPVCQTFSYRFMLVKYSTFRTRPSVLPRFIEIYVRGSARVHVSHIIHVTTVAAVLIIIYCHVQTGCLAHGRFPNRNQ